MAEPLKATFFTLKRRDRAVLLPATLVFIVVMALILAAFAALNWSTLVQFREFFLSAGAGEQMGDEHGARFVMGMFGFIGMIFLFMFPLYFTVAAYEAACLRWMIRGEAPGVFGFTIDNDVWRVYGVYWCWFIAQFVVSTATSILTMPLIFMTMGEIMRDPSPEAMWRWQLTVQLPIVLLQYIPLIFIGVRFGPAAATSVLRKRFSFFDAWKVTKGRFWALFGSFATLWLIFVLLSAAAAIPLTLHMWPYFESMWSAPSNEKLGEYFDAYFASRTLMLVALAYGVMFIAGLWLAVMQYGVNACAAIAAREEGKIKPYEESGAAA
jgi:hypothetical protein